MTVSEAYFHFSADQPLAEALAEMPSSVRSFLQRGYEVVTRTDAATRQTLFEVGLKALDTPQEPPSGDAAKLGMEPADYRAAIGAATFAILALGGSRLKPQEFVSALASAGVIADGHVPDILPFVEVLAREHNRIKSSISSISAGRAVLAALNRIEWVVDLRVRDEEGDVPKFIPVAIIRFSTDHRDNELLCQATLPQLDYLLEELTRLRKRLIGVQDWKNMRTPS